MSSRRRHSRRRRRTRVAGMLRLRNIPSEILAGMVIDLQVWSLLLNDSTMRKLLNNKDWPEHVRFNRNAKNVQDMIRDMMTVEPWDGDIVKLNISGSHHLTDFGLSTIKAMCTRLVDLDISRCVGITDVGVRDLVLQCSQLEFLNISGCGQLQGGCLVAVAEACTNLRSLNTSRCMQLQTWAFHKLFNCCTKLEVLDVSSTQFTNQEMLTLAHNVSTITSLNIEDCPPISDTGIIAVVEHSPNLECLFLTRHTLAFRVTDTSLLPVGQRCKMLQQLDISGCEFISDVGIDWLTNGCHHLTDLNVAGCVKLTDASLRAIAQHCRALKSIVLTNNHEMTNLGVRQLAMNCIYLRKVVLDGLFLLCEPTTRSKAPKFHNRPARSVSADSILQRNANIEDMMDPQSFTPIGGLAALSTSCKSLTSLSLVGCFRLNQSFRLFVSKHLKDLQQLNLSGCNQISEASMAQLFEGCNNITELDVSDCHAGITSEVIHIMARCLKQLARLVIQNCLEVNDYAIQAIGSFRQLEYLDLSNCKKLKDESMLPLCQPSAVPVLKYLYIINIPGITDSGFSWLVDGCPKLELFSLKGTRVSKYAMATVKERFQYSELLINPNFIGFTPVSRVGDRMAINAYGRFRQALCYLQARHRAYLQRQKYLKRLAEKKRQESATIIQNFAKIIAAKKKALLRRDQLRREHASATKIASIVRMRRAQFRVAELKKRIWMNYLEDMASKIALAWRRRMERMKVYRLFVATQLLKKKRTAAAIVMQCWTRRILAKAHVAKIWKHKAAEHKMRSRKALLIQKTYRGFHQRKLFKQLKADRRMHFETRQQAASTIQKTWRNFKTMKIVKKSTHRRHLRGLAACKIQSMVRGFNTRREVYVEILANRELAFRHAAVVVQSHWRARVARIELKHLREQYKKWLGFRIDAAVTLQKYYRGYQARAILFELKEEAREKMLAFVKVELASAILIQSVWRGVLGRRRYAEAYWQRRGMWKRLYHEEQHQICFYNQLTGEVRWRMPQDLLELLAKPICQNCEYYLAAIECADCGEQFCTECHYAVHSGGKRVNHTFRSLYDYYDKRIDYGEGEYPSKWPTEMQQDEIKGWMLRVSPLRQPINVYGSWEEYCDEQSGQYFYFNRDTFETSYDSSVVNY